MWKKMRSVTLQANPIYTDRTLYREYKCNSIQSRRDSMSLSKRRQIFTFLIKAIMPIVCLCIFCENKAKIQTLILYDFYIVFAKFCIRIRIECSEDTANICWIATLIISVTDRKHQWIICSMTRVLIESWCILQKDKKTRGSKQIRRYSVFTWTYNRG